MYERIEHTADVGLRIEAATLNDLFAEAARALFELIVPNLAHVRASQAREVELRSDSLADLLCDWLTELVFLLETQRVVLDRFRVQVDEARFSLQAEATGEPLDTSRHQLGYEIKAVTYHELKLERAGGGWRAEVILDI